MEEKKYYVVDGIRYSEKEYNLIFKQSMRDEDEGENNSQKQEPQWLLLFFYIIEYFNLA